MTPQKALEILFLHPKDSRRGAALEVLKSSLVTTVPTEDGAAAKVVDLTPSVARQWRQLDPVADRISNHREAAHFLRQATNGPTWQEIERAVELGSRKLWIREQMLLNFPKSFRHTAYEDYGATDLGSNGDNRKLAEALFTNLFRTNAGLRARLLKCLAVFFPVSVPGGGFSGASEIYDVIPWYDRLNNHVFGNFRDLLESVTYSNSMARMLTYFGNERESADGTKQPDENYAREVMQLFTIGLFELNRDGTQKLDSAGRPIHTYTNEDVRQMARVFTGLVRPDHTDATYSSESESTKASAKSVWGGTGYRTMFYSNPEVKLRHMYTLYEWGPKRALGGLVDIPNQTPPEQNLKMALDGLFNHPSCAPYVCKRFIQMLVSSNPSPDYVGRVVSAFENNGKGVRGDMRAMWTAILTDPEAAVSGARVETSGRMLDGFEAFYFQCRSLNRGDAAGRLGLVSGSQSETDNVTGRSVPYNVPSIFGAYDPTYAEGEVATWGLVSPELKQWPATNLINSTNNLRVRTLLYAPFQSAADYVYRSDYSMLPLSSPAADLIERVNLLLCGGAMSNGLRQDLQTLTGSLPVSTLREQQDRATLILAVVVSTPDYRIQL